MSSEKNIITIDGPAGSGKGTVAKIVARKVGYSYLDTGAMYRTVALAVRKNNVDTNNSNMLNEFLDSLVIEIKNDESNEPIYLLNSIDVTGDIRDPGITMLSSRIATLQTVRSYLVGLQRKIGSKGSLVAEGRDMGTYVFPDAKYKFFLDAKVEERANRRYRELVNNKKNKKYHMMMFLKI